MHRNILVDDGEAEVQLEQERASLCFLPNTKETHCHAVVSRGERHIGCTLCAVWIGPCAVKRARAWVRKDKGDVVKSGSKVCLLSCLCVRTNTMHSCVNMYTMRVRTSTSMCTQISVSTYALVSAIALPERADEELVC